MYLCFKRLLLITISLSSSILFAAVPSENWKTLSTEHFNIHFLPLYQEQAKRSAFISENLYPKLEDKLGWLPKEKISMVIIDEHDQSNGSATPYPFNKVILRLSPPDRVGQLDDYDDWLALLIEHELTHIFHLDKSIGKVSNLRNVFGRFSLLFPNLFQPRWFIEGLATYVETHAGIGRGQSSSFEMLMREEVTSGLLPVATVNLPADSQPLERHYLYGVYFYQFLRDTYGEEFITQLINNYSDNLLPFSINSNSKSVFGKDISQLWSEFSAYLNNRFSKQLNVLNQSNIKEGTAIVDTVNQLAPIGFLDNDTLVYIENDLESEPKLMMLKNSKKELLAVINNNSLFNVGAGNIIYLSQLDYCDEYHLYYDIYRFNVVSKEIEQLTQCSRYKYFTVSSSNNIVAVKTVASIPQIDLLDANAKLIKTLWKGSYGDVINYIDWSEKRNALLVTKKELNKSWNIYELNLDTLTWRDVVVDNAIFMQASYAFDEEGIVFISDSSGVHNIYKKLFKSPYITALTNVLSGAFSPLQHESKLYYQRFERKGYRIHSSDLETAAPITIKKASVINIRFDKYIDTNKLNYVINDYSPWHDLKPKYWFPWLLIQDNASEFGFMTSSNDSLDHHFYQLQLAYVYDQEDTVGSFLYQYENWLGFLISKENSIYTNTANLTNRIRTNEQFQVSFTLPFTKIKNRWRFKLGLIDNREGDTYLASGASGSADQKDGMLGLSAFYDSKQSFLKGHSAETGRDVLLVAESSDVLDSDYSGQTTILDWREYIKLGPHNTLAVRYAIGSADVSMRNYKLGGLQSDWDSVTVFNPQVVRNIFNKRGFALRGYAENTQIGNNIELATIEWRFPLLHVEKGIMAPPVGVMKYSGRLFVEAGAAWFDNQQKDSISSVGLEWIIDLNLFYNITPQIRIGYAEGLDDLGEQTFYLKVGGAF